MTQTHPPDHINSFYDEWSFLSNFAASAIVVNGHEYPTVEHAFQAFKTTNKDEHERIRLASSPGQAKQIGRRVMLRPEWEGTKDAFMFRLLRIKFSDPWMRQHLDETGVALLVEGNTWHDNYWGNCSCAKCKNTPGLNKLGVLLMKIRKEIRGELPAGEVSSP